MNKDIQILTGNILAKVASLKSDLVSLETLLNYSETFHILTVPKRIDYAISQINETFTIKNIIHIFALRDPNIVYSRTNISNYLSALAKENKTISLLEKGKGSAPNIYKRLTLEK